MAGDAEKPGSDPIYFSPFDGLMDLFNRCWCGAVMMDQMSLILLVILCYIFHIFISCSQSQAFLLNVGIIGVPPFPGCFTFL